MLTIVTPAGSYDLTSLATVKAELEITRGAEDGDLARWIKQASDAIAKHCNRIFARETVSETFRTRCREDGLLLSRFPVTGLISVVENDATLTAADYELAGDGSGGVLNRLRCDRDWTWPTGKIVVTYTAGYALVTDLPEGIERAAILLVTHYRSTAGRDAFLRSEEIPGVRTASYQDVPTDFDFPPEVRGLLDRARKPAGS
jgi:uncharacterized phiE125 gp8 family phage protein